MANKFAQQQSVQAEKNKRKSSKSRIIAALTATVLVLAAVVLILSLITAKPVNMLKITKDNIDAVEIRKASGDVFFLRDEGQSNTAEFIDKLSDMNFSVMRGILEGKVKTRLMVNLEYNNEDDETELTNPVRKSEIDGLNSEASADNYLVRIWLKNGSKQTVSVGGKEITYNKIVFFVPAGENEISKNRVYLYDTLVYDGEDFETYETYFYGNTYPVREYLVDMFELEK